MKNHSRVIFHSPPYPYLTGRLSEKSVPSPHCDEVSHLTFLEADRASRWERAEGKPRHDSPAVKTSPTSIIWTDSFYLGVLMGIGNPHAYHGKLVFFFVICPPN